VEYPEWQLLISLPQASQSESVQARYSHHGNTSSEQRLAVEMYKLDIPWFECETIAFGSDALLTLQRYERGGMQRFGV